MELARARLAQVAMVLGEAELCLPNTDHVARWLRVQQEWGRKQLWLRRVAREQGVAQARCGGGSSIGGRGRGGLRIVDVFTNIKY